MSTLYTFTPATDNLPQYLREVVDLSKAVKDDPLDRSHIEPALGLAGCANASLPDNPVGPFGASKEPDDIEDVCDEIVSLCESHNTAGFASGGVLWGLLAPLLARLVERLIVRVID